ncbi:MAG: OmpA family protein, partial [Bryobacteraceae bacterium]
MFSEVRSPTGHFALVPMPGTFFENPSPFGGSALLVLNRFDNNSAKLRSEHLQGITVAAAQASGRVKVLELYGITDRSGSDALNMALSIRRADAALAALSTALGLGPNNITFANGLGERFADQYFMLKQNARDPTMRGVACYLWDSLSTARDPFLRVAVAFAAPPRGGIG